MSMQEGIKCGHTRQHKLIREHRMLPPEELSGVFSTSLISLLSSPTSSAFLSFIFGNLMITD